MRKLITITTFLILSIGLFGQTLSTKSEKKLVGDNYLTCKVFSLPTNNLDWGKIQPVELEIPIDTISIEILKKKNKVSNVEEYLSQHVYKCIDYFRYNYRLIKTDKVFKIFSNNSYIFVDDDGALFIYLSLICLDGLEEVQSYQLEYRFLSNTYYYITKK